MRIGLFGGTFDPVHFGHLRSALEVKEACGLDQVLLIPGARPPHKGQGAVAAAGERLRMLELAVGSGSELTVSDLHHRHGRTLPRNAARGRNRPHHGFGRLS